MDKSIDQLIDKYVNHTATAEEVKQIEQLMTKDDTLAKEVRFRQNLKAVAAKADEARFKSALNEIATDTKTSKPVKPLYWMFAAAAIVVIGLFAFNFWNTSKTDSIFQTHYEPYRNVVKPIVRGENKMDSLSQAFYYYETQKYDEALKYFDDLSEGKNAKIIEFYKAMIFIEQEKYDKAYQLLESYAQTTDPKLLAQSLWFRALLNIKNKEREKAKNQLQELINLGGFKTSSAETILQDL